MRLKQFQIIIMVLQTLVVHCWCEEERMSPDLIKELKSALLPLLGLGERPKINGPIFIPDHMKDLYKLQTSFESDTMNFPIHRTGNANTVRSFVHLESKVDKVFKRPHLKFRFKFNPEIPKNEILTAATLKIKSIGTGQNINQVILVKEILKPGIKGKRKAVTRPIDTQMVNIKYNKTIDLDVYSAVARWIAQPKQNYGLIIEVVGNKTLMKEKNLRLKRNTNETIEWVRDQPILLTFTDDGKYKPRKGEEMKTIRRKRMTNKSGRSHKRERDPCRRRSMYVNFHDVGWNDWIVAPLGYDAFYCAGDCDYPFPEHMNTTNHAIVQSLMNSVRPVEVPKPCCVPTQLSSMSMLYVDAQSKVILKNYKEMVVQGCGCR